MTTKRFLALLAVTLLVAGCSPKEEELPGYDRGSGDLAQFIVQNATRMGVSAKQTNAVPPFTGEWRYKQDAGGFQIYIAGNHFNELHSMLTSAFGPPVNSPATNDLDGTVTISAAYGDELGGRLNYSFEKSRDGNQFTSLAFSKGKQ